MATHCKPVSDPCESGMLPLPVTDRSHSVAHIHVDQSTASITTHCKAVNEPNDSGMAPVSWLPPKSKCLQPRSQTVTAPHNTIRVRVHRHHHHSRQASQRAERLWDSASQRVALEVQTPGATIANSYSVAQHLPVHGGLSTSRATWGCALQAQAHAAQASHGPHTRQHAAQSSRYYSGGRTAVPQATDTSPLQQQGSPTPQKEEFRHSLQRC
jgi:hypothetical protein